MRFLGGLALLLTLAVCRHAAMAQDMRSLIIAAAGSEYRFEVEIADDAAERARGLMFRHSLAPNRGMIFLYPDAAPRSFWMKDTPIALDILFADAEGKIVHVAHQARPFDETPIPSLAPVAMVLEVNGGLAERLGIRTGDRIVLQAPTAP